MRLNQWSTHSFDDANCFFCVQQGLNSKSRWNKANIFAAVVEPELLFYVSVVSCVTDVIICSDVQGNVNKKLRSNIPWLKKIIWVIGVLRRTVVCNWCVQKPSSESSDSLSQLKIQKPWWAIWLVNTVDWVAIGKRVMWLAVKTCGVMQIVGLWDE